ncbi:MAG: Helix-turn-helix protein [Candidatus Moranbacteria bacterium GW2011_GWF1_36_4]|nr:MAG: Helix-turn-helix protein [Candidatus Moranbacteria bacterium GW2011_GWF1_36_4]
MLITREFSDRQAFAIERKYKNIKLKEIALVLGCSVPLLSLYENGRANMNDYFVKKYKQIINNK